MIAQERTCGPVENELQRGPGPLKLEKWIWDEYEVGSLSQGTFDVLAEAGDEHFTYWPDDVAGTISYALEAAEALGL